MTFNAGIVVCFFSGTLFEQRFGQTRAAPRHSAHRAPIRKVAHHTLHDERLASDIDHNFRAGLEIEPVADRFGDHYLTFGGNCRLGHSTYHGKTRLLP
jgi:hypothetical protein